LKSKDFQEIARLTWCTVAPRLKSGRADH